MDKYLIIWDNPYDFHTYTATIQADSPEQAVWNLAIETWLKRGQIHGRDIVCVTRITEE